MGNMQLVNRFRGLTDMKSEAGLRQMGLVE
jgi:hypothetical protein